MKIKRKFDPINFVLDHLATLVFTVLVLGLYIHTMVHSMMYSGSILQHLIMRVSAYLPMAIGVGCILMVGGMDLSAGRLMGFTALVSAALLQNVDAVTKVFPDLEPMPVITVLFIVIIIGVIISAVNGIIVSALNAPAFAVTLGTQIILYGGMFIFVGMGTNAGQNIFNLAYEYSDFVIGNSATPNYVLFAIGLALVMWILITFTPLGRMMRAVGLDKEAAKNSGINPMLMTMIAFIIAGAFYGYSGFVEAARVGGPGISAGANSELDALAACLIGGHSVKGGVGGIGGIIVGVILLQLVSICLQWLSISANVVYIIKGAIIILAIILDMLRLKIKKVEK